MNNKYSSWTLSDFQQWELQNIYKDLKEIKLGLDRLDSTTYLDNSDAKKLKNELKEERRQLLSELNVLLLENPGMKNESIEHKNLAGSPNKVFKSFDANIHDGDALLINASIEPGQENTIYEQKESTCSFGTDENGNRNSADLIEETRLRQVTLTSYSSKEHKLLKQDVPKSITQEPPFKATEPRSFSPDVRFKTCFSKDKVFEIIETQPKKLKSQENSEQPQRYQESRASAEEDVQGANASKRKHDNNDTPIWVSNNKQEQNNEYASNMMSKLYPPDRGKIECSKIVDQHFVQEKDEGLSTITVKKIFPKGTNIALTENVSNENPGENIYSSQKPDDRNTHISATDRDGGVTKIQKANETDLDSVVRHPESSEDDLQNDENHRDQFIMHLHENADRLEGPVTENKKDFENDKVPCSSSIKERFGPKIDFENNGKVVTKVSPTCYNCEKTWKNKLDDTFHESEKTLKSSTKGTGFATERDKYLMQSNKDALQRSLDSKGPQKLCTPDNGARIQNANGRAKNESTITVDLVDNARDVTELLESHRQKLQSNNEPYQAILVDDQYLTFLNVSEGHVDQNVKKDEGLSNSIQTEVKKLSNPELIEHILPDKNKEAKKFNRSISHDLVIESTFIDDHFPIVEQPTGYPKDRGVFDEDCSPHSQESDQLVLKMNDDTNSDKILWLGLNFNQGEVYEKGPEVWNDGGGKTQSSERDGGKLSHKDKCSPNDFSELSSLSKDTYLGTFDASDKPSKKFSRGEAHYESRLDMSKENGLHGKEPKSPDPKENNNVNGTELSNKVTNILNKPSCLSQSTKPKNAIRDRNSIPHEIPNDQIAMKPIERSSSGDYEPRDVNETECGDGNVTLTLLSVNKSQTRDGSENIDESELEKEKVIECKQAVTASVDQSSSKMVDNKSIVEDESTDFEENTVKLLETSNILSTAYMSEKNAFVDFGNLGEDKDNSFKHLVYPKHPKENIKEYDSTLSRLQKTEIDRKLETSSTHQTIFDNPKIADGHHENSFVSYRKVCQVIGNDLNLDMRLLFNIAKNRDNNVGSVSRVPKNKDNSKGIDENFGEKNDTHPHNTIENNNLTANDNFYNPSLEYITKSGLREVSDFESDSCTPENQEKSDENDKSYNSAFFQKVGKDNLTMANLDEKWPKSLVSVTDKEKGLVKEDSSDQGCIEVTGSMRVETPKINYGHINSFHFRMNVSFDRNENDETRNKKIFPFPFNRIWRLWAVWDPGKLVLSDVGKLLQPNLEPVNSQILKMGIIEAYNNSRCMRQPLVGPAC